MPSEREHREAGSAKDGRESTAPTVAGPRAPADRPPPDAAVPLTHGDEPPPLLPTLSGINGSPATLDVLAERMHTLDSPLPSIPGYEVLEVLGSGGMGVVYKARQTRLKRLVALKMLKARHASAEERTRFKTEAEAVARLRHANIVQIYEVGEHRGEPYFALEFAENGGLDEFLHSRPQPPRDSAHLLVTLALAVQAAHEQHIIHRDLKPANVLLQKKSPSALDLRPVPSEIRLKRGAIEAASEEVTLRHFEPKVTDFGLAKRLDSDQERTQTGAILGTPPYMAPEQTHGGNIGPWTDVYALGAILYELLIGRPPFLGGTVRETLALVREQDPVPPRRLQPRCPVDLETICLKCLHKRPESRYASALDLADDLRRWLNGQPILARPPSPRERLVKWVKRSPLAATASLTGVGFLAALLTALLVHLDAARKDAALQQSKFEEQQRLTDVRGRFETLFASANHLAATAKARDADAWATVERDLHVALSLIKGDAAFADFALREPAELLLKRAENERTGARRQEATSALLRRLLNHHGDAVYFATLFTGLELEENYQRVRTAARDGLAVFAGGQNPHDFDEEQRGWIAARCYELLLLDAEVLAQPRPNERPSAWHARLEQALVLYDRAEQLGLRTHAGQARRADCLEKLGRPDAPQARAEAARRTPTSALDFFLLGLDHYRAHSHSGDRRDLDLAGRHLAAALLQQPDHFGALYLLAVCRVLEGNAADARLHLTGCLKLRPDFHWPRLLRGAAAIELRDFRAAQDDLEDVLRRQTDPMARYVAHVNLSRLARRRGDWDRARADLERAIALNAALPAAHLDRARVQQERWDMPAWQEALLDAAPQGLSQTALSLQRRDGWAAAVAELTTALAHQPHASLYRERGRLRQRLGQYGQAEADFAEAIRLSSSVTRDLVHDLLALGQLLFERREHPMALRAFEEAEKHQPGNGEVQRLKALTLLRLGKDREAGVALERYLSQAPSAASGPEQAGQLVEASKELGKLRLRGGDTRAAIAAFSLGLRYSKGDADLLARRGWAHLDYASPQLALDDFQDALRQRRGDVDSLIGKADAEVKLGRLEEARSTVAAVEGKNDLSAQQLYNAARIHAQIVRRLPAPEKKNLGQETLADRCRKRAVELLGASLRRLPSGQAPAFWRDCVEKDVYFLPLLELPEILQLRQQHSR